MEIQIEYQYQEAYLPSKRHRKPRLRDASGVMTVEVPEIAKASAPIAFLVHEISKDKPTDFRLWNGQLWKPVLWRERRARAEGLYPVAALIKDIQCRMPYFSALVKNPIGKDPVEQAKRQYAERHVIIDGIVYEQTKEPQYVVMTFGLGHNHGGTSMFVEQEYNPNICKDRYFNALEREQAVELAKNIAISRGDTNDLSRIETTCNIEVLIPEAVHCNPQKEHGDGDPFLNKLYAVTKGSSSTIEAALLAMAILNKDINAN